MTGDNLVGELLGDRYTILEKIGTGGMATVYKAKDNLLNRNVAIKILRDSLEGEEQVVTNFVKEAQASAGLVHNNIVSVYDVGESDGLNYMVMELVDGITLKQYIKEKGVLPWQEACDYAIQIGQGISAAHKNNIIHCDIKPQNIIMTENKTVKVTDFGIAKAVTGGTVAANTPGGAMGSVHYISPEQARGGFTDARSDIYSMGIVIYEMLAGKVPFNGDTAVGIAMKHLEEEPVNVKCINFDIPTDLAYIVMKAIKKEPADRYQTVRDMLNDLHAVLAGEPLPSMQPGDEAEDVISKDRELIDDVYDEKTKAVTDGLENNQARRARTHVKETTGKAARKNARGKKTADQKKANRTAAWLAIATVIVIGLLGVGVYSIVNNFVLTVTVPDFSGMTVEEARAAAAEKSLTINDEDIEYSISDTAEDGKVITQEPEQGTSVDKNSNVKIVVSIGSRGGNIAVPDVKNKTRDEALTEINALNLKSTVVEESSDTVPAGSVIRQIPTAGTKLFAGDYVTIYISKGISAQPTQSSQASETATVPSIEGLDIDSARSALSEAGLTMGNVSVVTSDYSYGTVTSQSVAAGTQVSKGSSVGIVMSGGPETPQQETTEEAAETTETSSESDSSQTEEETTSSETSSENTTSSETSSEETTYSDTSSGETSAAGTETFYVDLPSDSNSEEAEVEVYVNGSLVYEGTHSPDEGSVPINISGTGTVNVTAYVNGVAQSQTIDFGN